MIERTHLVGIVGARLAGASWLPGPHRHRRRCLPNCCDRSRSTSAYSEERGKWWPPRRPNLLSRSTTSGMSIAKFPCVRTLEGFEYDAQPSVDPKQII